MVSPTLISYTHDVCETVSQSCLVSYFKTHTVLISFFAIMSNLYSCFIFCLKPKVIYFPSNPGRTSAYMILSHRNICRSLYLNFVALNSEFLKDNTLKQVFMNLSLNENILIIQLFEIFFQYLLEGNIPFSAYFNHLMKIWYYKSKEQ